MDNLTLATCSYNTPEVTITMLRSFFKYHGPTKVFVCDNSTNEKTSALLIENNVPFIRNIGGLHASSIDILIDRCETDYMLLADTDIIFLQDHKQLFKQIIDLDLTLLGEVCGDRGGKKLHKRVHPWHCFINVSHIKNNNIKFYDKNRLSNQTQDIIYDVGASFFEDIRALKLKIGDVKLQDTYFKHYEGMSWPVPKYGNIEGNIDIDPTATHNNYELYKYGKLIERLYSVEISAHQHIKINAI